VTLRGSLVLEVDHGGKTGCGEAGSCRKRGGGGSGRRFPTQSVEKPFIYSLPIFFIISFIIFCISSREGA